MVNKPKRMSKTRKANRPSQKVQHHHLLMRLELESCPLKEDKERIETMIGQIIKDVQMKSLATPRVYYMTYPRFNEGLTGIAPIETSHIAFHFWNRPDPRILHTGKANCLLQMDVYTCGSLTVRNIGLILHHLTQYKPSYIDVTLLNRNTGLTIDRHMHWNAEESPMSWTEWLATPVFH